MSAGEPPRSSPPRRGTDRVERALAWLIGALALSVLLTSLMVGVSTHLDGERASGREATPVPATLLEDVHVPPAPYGTRPITTARATWETAAGPRTGAITVRGSAAAGAVRQIWIDREGRPVPSPASPAMLLIKAVLGAAAVLVMGWSALGALWLGLRGLLRWRNGVAWQREWAAVEPRWSGRTTA